jgi:hypothetical protein
VKYAAVITCRVGKGERRTTATVYGSWAVHRSLDPRSREWAITHVPSGLAIPREHTWLLTKAQALEVAKLVDASHGARKVTHKAGAIIAQLIHRVLTRDTKRTPGELQHDADVAEGCA